MRRKGLAGYVVSYLLCCFSLCCGCAAVQQDTTAIFGLQPLPQKSLLFASPIEPYLFTSRLFMSDTIFSGFSTVKIEGPTTGIRSPTAGTTPTKVVSASRFRDHLRFAVAYCTRSRLLGNRSLGGPTIHRRGGPGTHRQVKVKADAHSSFPHARSPLLLLP